MDTQFFSIPVQESDKKTKRYNFNVNCPWPVKELEIQLGALIATDSPGYVMVLSDLNPDYPNIIGTVKYTSQTDPLISSMTIKYSKPVDVIGTHWIGILRSDGKTFGSDVDNPDDRDGENYQATIFMNLKFIKA